MIAARMNVFLSPRALLGGTLHFVSIVESVNFRHCIVGGRSECFA